MLQRRSMVCSTSNPTPLYLDQHLYLKPVFFIVKFKSKDPSELLFRNNRRMWCETLP